MGSIQEAHGCLVGGHCGSGQTCSVCGPMSALQLDAHAQVVARTLREGRPVLDADFDLLLSQGPREKSPRFWSAVEVAQTAARWFSEAEATRVLDVGAGAGKFCTIASLTTGHRVWGLEQRGHLVFEARKLAQRLQAEVVMIEGSLAEIEPERFDGLYFYNPFAEHILEPADRYDEALAASPDAYVQSARTVEGWLKTLPVGTVMVTFNGLGGRIPSSWRCDRRQRLAGNMLRRWVKGPEAPVSDLAWIEVQDVTVTAEALRRLVEQHPGAPLDEMLMVLRLISD